MCLILNGFQDRGTRISLYNSLDLAPNIVLSSGMSVGVKRQLAVVTIVTLQEPCEKRRTSSQMRNMLIYCMLFSHELQSALMLTV
jgi:hypothetical protein